MIPLLAKDEVRTARLSVSNKLPGVAMQTTTELVRYNPSVFTPLIAIVLEMVQAGDLWGTPGHPMSQLPQFLGIDKPIL